MLVVVLGVLLLGTVTSCSDSGLGGMPPQLQQLQRICGALVKEYGHKDIRGGASDGVLSVQFVNSEFGTLPEEQQKTKAGEIARFLFESCEDAKTIREIVVVFRTEEQVPGSQLTKFETSQFKFTRPDPKDGGP